MGLENRVFWAVLFKALSPVAHSLTKEMSHNHNHNKTEPGLRSVFPFPLSLKSQYVTNNR